MQHTIIYRRWYFHIGIREISLSRALSLRYVSLKPLAHVMLDDGVVVRFPSIFSGFPIFAPSHTLTYSERYLSTHIHIFPTWCINFDAAAGKPKPPSPSPPVFPDSTAKHICFVSPSLTRDITGYPPAFPQSAVLTWRGRHRCSAPLRWNTPNPGTPHTITATTPAVYILFATYFAPSKNVNEIRSFANRVFGMFPSKCVQPQSAFPIFRRSTNSNGIKLDAVEFEVIKYVIHFECAHWISLFR